MTTDDPMAANDAALRDRRSDQPLRFYNVRLSDRDAWFGATVAALFNVLGMLLEAAIVRKTPGVSGQPAAVSAFVGLMILVVLFIRRKTPSVKWAAVLYLVNATSVVTVLLFTNRQFAVSEANWVPFQADKLGCLIAAMVAPGFWVGLLSILAHALGPLLQFEFFFPAELKAQVAPAEPWPILAFGLAGVLALVYRFRRAQLEQEMARIQAQNLAIKRIANAFLNIRDLMNTPLQVIEISIGLLRDSNQPPRPILDRIDRAAQSLREINSVLVQHEREIEWQSKSRMN
jgi:hypothetical protein